ncbi:UNVERIFIED_CONTAM: matrixin family metalloprotease [Microbacterium sp. SLM126]
MTWDNNAPAGDYYNSGTAAGYAWASATDVDGMSPSNGLMVGYLDNKGPNTYSGWTTWGCNGSLTTFANVTLNPYYTNAFSVANKKRVWMHELGHGLGMGHSTSAAIMYSCPTCTSFTAPQTDDKNGINARY